MNYDAMLYDRWLWLELLLNVKADIVFILLIILLLLLLPGSHTTLIEVA